MQRHQPFLGSFSIAILAVMGLLACRSTLVAADAKESAEKLVQQALTAELRGDTTQHRTLIQASLARDPGLPTANWQSGRVRAYGDWIAVQEAEQLAQDDPQLLEYRRLRDSTNGKPESELRLARWCANHQQRDLARLHYARLITASPNDASLADEAARRAGIGFVQGQLLTHEELAQQVQSAQRKQEALDRWRPRLERLAHQLEAPKNSLANSSLTQFGTSTDDELLPAIESFVDDSREAFVKTLLGRLSERPSFEATQVLLRYALFSPIVSVRDMATDELRKRPQHDYVPQLLTGLRYPIRANFNIVRNRLTGETRYQHVFIQDGDQETTVVETDHRARPVRGRDGSDEARVTESLKLLEQMVTASFRQTAVALDRERTALENSQIYAVLEATTREKLPREASKWRDWWVSYNETGPTRRTNYQYVPTVDNYRASSGPSLAGGPAVGVGHECFAPGTVVWTQTGKTVIHKIKVGDRVLSQDPHTGELSYKVVLQTTTNAPIGGLSRITVNGNALDLTNGHVVWVAKKGWRMAKELESDSTLHGIGGFFALQNKEDIPSIPFVYNLVVADFHTFFVGEGILVHDITPRGHTHALVPGLVPKTKELDLVLGQK